MPKIQHILCPVDFSPNSDRALDYAFAIAKRLDAQVTLLHAYTLPNFVMPDGIMLPGAELLAQMSVDAQVQLDQRKAKYGNQGVPIQLDLTMGAPDSEIASIAEKRKADLIIMGTHGRTGLQHLLLGSTAERVVRASKVAVMTIREPKPDEAATQTDKPSAEVARVLCPVDFSDASSAAMLYAADLARGLNAELHLVHVWTPMVYTSAPEAFTLNPGLLEEIRHDIGKRLEALGVSVAGTTLKVRTTVAEGIPYKEISNTAEHVRADLIVMGTHGRTGFEHFLLGSVAERVLRTATRPVITVPLNS